MSLDIPELTQESIPECIHVKTPFVYCLAVYQLILVRHIFIQAGKQNWGLECDQRISLFSSGSCSTNSLGIKGRDQEYNSIREEESA